VAALFDTTVAVLLLRRTREVNERGGPAELVRAARAEIEGGAAILPSVAVSELVIGERSAVGSARLASLLSRLPTAILPAEGARHAGLMGSFLRERGGSIPLPDLLIAATAVWLDVPLLTWDADYSRSAGIAKGSRSRHEGAQLLRELRLHPASR
jgi:predicted nucleic acid-binding protein